MNHQKQDRNRLLLKMGAVLFAVLFLVSAGLLALSWWEKQYATYSDAVAPMEEELEYNGVTYVRNENVETLLMLGLDTFGNEASDSYRNDKQADFLTLLVLDKSANTCKAIQINRDTMARMNVLGVAGNKVDSITAQLALAHTYGNGKEVSCRNVANAVAELLGVPVHHYVSLSMDAVPVYNDLVGGVPVEIRDDFSSIDATMIQGETVALTGQQALLYVRSRQGLDDPSNQQRMGRQKQYLQALLERTEQCIAEDESFVTNAVLQVSNYMVSDCTANRLEELMSRYAIREPQAIYTIEGTTQMGEEFLEFYPDADSIRQIVVDCFYTPEE